MHQLAKKPTEPRISSATKKPANGIFQIQIITGVIYAISQIVGESIAVLMAFGFISGSVITTGWYSLSLQVPTRILVVSLNTSIIDLLLCHKDKVIRSRTLHAPRLLAGLGLGMLMGDKLVLVL